MAKTCTHVYLMRAVTPRSAGCEECMRIADEWVHLRLCLTCGHVGCCDDSKNKHATLHFHSTRHPIIESLEPGEDWRWCYVDEVLFSSEADTRPEENENATTDTLSLVNATESNGRVAYLARHP